MDNNTKLGIAALLLIGGALYWRLTKKGAEVAQAVKEGGSGGAAPGGVAHEMIRVPVMVADVSPVISPRPMSLAPAPAPAKPVAAASLGSISVGMPSVKPKTPVLPAPVGGGKKATLGADGYQWKSDYAG